MLSNSVSAFPSALGPLPTFGLQEPEWSSNVVKCVVGKIMSVCVLSVR